MSSPLIEKLMCRWPTERWRGLTVVVGCSGGADSIALLVALCQLKPPDTTLIAAHFNHQLRGLESDQDQRFVEETAKRLDCVCIVGTASPSELVQSAERSPSEATLRDRRYRFLQHTAELQGARYVAVAHTADDSVETTLHHLARGTGLAGLTGISPYRDLNPDLVLIRPLIDVWRNEILEYLASSGQEYRHDSSNDLPTYTRNRIRNRWLPMMEADMGVDIRIAIQRSSAILAEIDAWLESQAREWLDQHTIRSYPEGIELQSSLRVDLEWPVIQRALTLLWQQKSWPLMAMTHSLWNQLRQQFQSPSSHSMVVELPSRIRVFRTDERWVLERTKSL